MIYTWYTNDIHMIYTRHARVIHMMKMETCPKDGDEMPKWCQNNFAFDMRQRSSGHIQNSCHGSEKYVHKTPQQVFWDWATDPDLHHRCLTRSLVWVGNSHSIFILSRKIRKESSCQRRPPFTSPSIHPARPESRSAIRRQLAMQWRVLHSRSVHDWCNRTGGVLRQLQILR